MQPQKTGRTLATLVVTAAAFSMLGGCATVTTGSDQAITVQTTPEGAKCLMTRDGKTVGAISSTPGTVSVDKSRHPIQIQCEKPGHVVTTEVVESNFQGATLGNILIGGIVGIAIDAGSGAMNKYPSSIELVLVPTHFETAEARDAFFDRLVAKVQTEEATAMQKVEETCENESECQRKRELVKTSVSEQLERIEVQRASAQVG